jgi:hypothetical protein
MEAKVRRAHEAKTSESPESRPARACRRDTSVANVFELSESCGHSGQQSSPKAITWDNPVANPNFIDDRRTASANGVASSPQSCPSCLSPSILSTAKIPDANSYWRCSRCGEVWNPARRATEATQGWRR